VDGWIAQSPAETNMVPSFAVRRGIVSVSMKTLTTTAVASSSTMGVDHFVTVGLLGRSDQLLVVYFPAVWKVPTAWRDANDTLEQKE
jgi:hypothetical protein